MLNQGESLDKPKGYLPILFSLTFLYACFLKYVLLNPSPKLYFKKVYKLGHKLDKCHKLCLPLKAPHAQKHLKVSEKSCNAEVHLTLLN